MSSGDFVVRLRVMYREAETGEYSEQEEVIHAVPGMFIEIAPPQGLEVVRARASCEMPGSGRPEHD